MTAGEFLVNIQDRLEIGCMRRSERISEKTSSREYLKYFPSDIPQTDWKFYGVHYELISGLGRKSNPPDDENLLYIELHIERGSRDKQNRDTKIYKHLVEKFKRIFENNADIKLEKWNWGYRVSQVPLDLRNITNQEDVLGKVKEKFKMLYNRVNQTVIEVLQSVSNESQAQNHFETEGFNEMGNYQNEYSQKLIDSRNIIFHGAPGTWKTYLAKQIAADIITGGKTMNFDMMSEDEAKQKEFEQQIEFVQFHPSYDYSDFVEGLRPVSEGGVHKVGFARKDGVFKDFCKRAIVGQVKGSDFPEIKEDSIVWKVSLQRTGENSVRTDCLENGYIRIGWVNYGDVENFDEFDDFSEGGKSELCAFQNQMKEGDIVVSCYSATETDAIGIITGEYEYHEEGGDYPRYRKVRWLTKIRKNILELNNGKRLTLSTVYKLKIPVSKILEFVKLDTPTRKSEVPPSEKKYIFIIDEINRGEISKVLGELFFSIDPGYRGTKGKVKTQYQNLIESDDVFKDGFYIPENVYVIGTMNDIDRSVDSFDFAMRRRFRFIELKADACTKMLDEVKDPNLREDAKSYMTRLNKEISKIPDLNESYHIGPAYFLKLNDINEQGSDAKFRVLWDEYIQPLLQEYVRGMPNATEIMKGFEKEYFKAKESATDDANSDSESPSEDMPSTNDGDA